MGMMEKRNQGGSAVVLSVDRGEIESIKKNISKLRQAVKIGQRLGMKVLIHVNASLDTETPEYGKVFAMLRDNIECDGVSLDGMERYGEEYVGEYVGAVGALQEVSQRWAGVKNVINANESVKTRISEQLGDLSALNGIFIGTRMNMAKVLSAYEIGTERGRKANNARLSKGFDEEQAAAMKTLLESYEIETMAPIAVLDAAMRAGIGDVGRKYIKRMYESSESAEVVAANISGFVRGVLESSVMEMYVETVDEKVFYEASDQKKEAMRTLLANLFVTDSAQFEGGKKLREFIEEMGNVLANSTGGESLSLQGALDHAAQMQIYVNMTGQMMSGNDLDTMRTATAFNLVVLDNMSFMPDGMRKAVDKVVKTANTSINATRDILSAA
jgi:hypothetical protein